MPTLRHPNLRGLIVFLALALGFASAGYASAQAPDPAELEQGARLYADNCASCHGEDGQGRKGATLAKNWPSIRPDVTIKATIERGIQGSAMPAWSQANGGPLTDAEIDALVLFILNWSGGGPNLIAPAPTSLPRSVLTAIPDIEGDPNNGAVLYDQDCAYCHGADGQGRVGARLAKSWPSLRPDLNIKSTVSIGISGSPMPAWSQANGGPLTESEIDDIVAYVMTFSGPSMVGQPTAAAAIPPSPFSGASGLLLAVGLFVLLIVVTLLLQTRGNKPE